MKTVALILTLAPLMLDAQEIDRLLPDSTAGWTKSDSSRLFAGNLLFRLIDGGAEVYNEYGFVEAITQRYSNKTNNYVDVEIYRMINPASAYGIFSMTTFKTGNRTDSLADACEGDGFLLFWKGDFYVSLTSSKPLFRSGLIAIAREISSRISGSHKPWLVEMFEHFDSLESTATKIAYLKGKLGLYNIVAISFDSDFTFEEGVCIESAGVDALVFPQRTDDECRKVYSSVADYFRRGNEWSVLRANGESTRFHGDLGFLQCERTGRYLVVLTSENQNHVEAICDRLNHLVVQHSP